MAYSFNGTNQRISVASVPFSGNNPITIAALFNSNSSTAAQVLVGFGFTGADTQSAQWIAARGDTTGDPIELLTRDSAGTTDDFRTTNGYTINTWGAAAGVLTSTTSRAVYRDGVNSATSTATITSTTNQNTFNIGGLLRTTAALFTSGLIAEVGVWTAALNAEEVNSLAKGFKPHRVRPQSLVFYSPRIRDLRDLRSDRALTNTNTATVANHPRVY
jgi:hypothetical protein